MVKLIMQGSDGGKDVKVLFFGLSDGNIRAERIVFRLPKM